MKCLKDFKEDIHKCSKCGLCQKACPIYQVTGNDCTVSRGQFIMLKGIIRGELKMTPVINRYLDICLKCGACSKYCPSGIDAVDIIVAAKHEYFKNSLKEKCLSFIKKTTLFGILPDIANIFSPKAKSKKFNKKVIYFGGCNAKAQGNRTVVKLLNKLEIEVITPNFPCCGISMFSSGDLASYRQSIKKYINVLKKYDIKEIVTTCASCEKTIKDYVKWCENNEDKNFLSEIKIKNIFEYIRENQLKIKLKTPIKATFHKPCNINNMEDIDWILNNTENLEYVHMKDFDKCCGLNGLFQIKEQKIMKSLFKNKRNNILNSGAKIVLTSCQGCEVALKSYSKGKYKVYDLLNFLWKNSVK